MFGVYLVHAWYMQRKLKNPVLSKYTKHILSMYQTYTKHGTLWRKCQHILKIPHQNMLGTLVQFFLSFTGSVHCDHVVWEIVKIFLNNLRQNTVGTFFGNFLNFPNNFLTGTLKSHGLVHCKSAEHVLHWGYCRDIGSEYSKYTNNMLVRYVLSILAPVLTMYSACTGLVHHPLPPVTTMMLSGCM